MIGANRLVAREIVRLLNSTDGTPIIPRVTLAAWAARLAPPAKRKLRTRPRTPTIRELDALCRKIVFARDRGVCQWMDPLTGSMCERSTGLMDWSHVLAKGAYRNLRHDPMNSVVMCRTHHMQWHGMIKGGAPSIGEYYVWKFGATEWLALERRAAAKGKTDRCLVKLHLQEEAKRWGVSTE